MSASTRSSSDARVELGAQGSHAFSVAGGAAAYAALVRPQWSEMLKLLRLDAPPVRAEGVWIWLDGSEAPVLDLVGGFGALPFGHNHPALVRTAIEHLSAKLPVFTQGMLRASTGALASRLAARTELALRSGPWHVLFGNSGAEAVEIALRHAFVRRCGPVVALEGAFHGRTLGALQLTANPAHREGMPEAYDVIRVEPGDCEALGAAFRDRAPAALFLELVQGEGGIVPLPREFVAMARELCSAAGADLIVDEAQTGLGRTGAFLACERFELVPDVVLLAKGLGGGIVKTSAALVHERRWRPEVSALHTSTFADDEFSSAVALAVVELLDDERLRANCRLGERLTADLREVAAEFPDVVREVRGVGLLHGVELRPVAHGTMLPALGEDLGLLAAAWLFHRHRIRVLPTLSSPLTLRVQPPFITAADELHRFIEALRDLGRVLRAGDLSTLCAFLVDGPSPRAAVTTPAMLPRRSGYARLCEEPAGDAPRVGWVIHPLDGDDLASHEPSLAEWTLADREALLRRFESRVLPIDLRCLDVLSATGAKARVHVIVLPLTARRVREKLEGPDAAEFRDLVERAVAAAAALRCDVVSLGQYTSIATMNGLALRRRGIGVTTGNALAVALGVEELEREVDDLGSRTVAVVGAAGNIGDALAQMLASRCARLMLVGRDAPGSIARMQSLGIRGAQISTDSAVCLDASVVIVAVSSAVAPVRSEHLADGAVVLDLSVPAGVEVRGRPDVTVLRGGIVRLPHGEDVAIAGFPLRAGEAFACMAEGIVLALEGVHDREFTGRVTPAKVERIGELARRHGFVLAGRKSAATWGETDY